MNESSSEDEDNLISDTPADSAIAANIKLRCDSLPSKSREKYEAAYNTFQQWKTAKEVKMITENVMLAYFGELAEKFKPSTLWSTYSMLRSTISINDNIQLENFKQLVGYLKQKSVGFEGKKSEVFSANEIKTFLDNAPDNQYLATKVVLIFGISGACCSSELTKLTVNEVLNRDDMLVIKLKKTRTNVKRTFTIEGEFLKVVQAYQALRPENATTDRFFINYRDGRCMSQAIGKNKLGKMPMEIAKFLKLPNPELYTGYCFRRSSSKLSAEQDTDVTEIKRLRGWKSTTVEEGFIEESVSYKRKTGQQVLSAVIDSSSNTVTFENPQKRQKNEEPDDEVNAEASTSKNDDDEEEESSEITVKLRGQKLCLQLTHCSNIKINLVN